MKSFPISSIKNLDELREPNLLLPQTTGIFSGYLQQSGNVIHKNAKLHSSGPAPKNNPNYPCLFQSSSFMDV
jgi:hypothetical protein